jgi:predicted  nucleic acid-binding Zn-ribbon protein
LQERLQAAQEELSQLRDNHAELKKTSDEKWPAWIADKKMLEDTIVDLSNSEKHAETDRSSRENEIRQLEERANVGLYSFLDSKPQCLIFVFCRLRKSVIPTKS